ncbi:anti-sigma-I factor RsgI8 [Mugil cephalus]|uniref:anti-sigma-I factor RsgI8 n=1 Tax=Mugil cephalus TaxID=48193 RepID=UPI001FB77D9F|nr:anti-sigma-I factor RsgI8 [Mugil cephalus]
MKVHLIVPMAIVVSVLLLGFMKVRKNEQEQEIKRLKFQEIKLRVADDVLSEFKTEQGNMQDQLDKSKNDQTALDKEAIELNSKADKLKGEVDICQGEKKAEADKSAAEETGLNNLRAELEKESVKWKDEETVWKTRLGGRSKVCDYLKKDAVGGKNLCGEALNEAAKPAEPKAEAPKQEEAKPEAPKQEEAKPEAPKQEEAKPDAPKPEEAKPDAPKPEEAKPDAPKPEEAKPDAPNAR